jgi:transposase-like protein
MRKSRFSTSQREAIVSSHLKGSKTVEQLCEAHQISPATFYKWKNESETVALLHEPSTDENKSDEVRIDLVKYQKKILENPHEAQKITWLRPSLVHFSHIKTKIT